MWLGAAEAVLAGAGRGGVVRVLCWGGGEAQVPAVSSVQAAALLRPAPTTQTRQLGGETVRIELKCLKSLATPIIDLAWVWLSAHPPTLPLQGVEESLCPLCRRLLAGLLGGGGQQRRAAVRPRPHPRLRVGVAPPHRATRGQLLQQGMC